MIQQPPIAETRRPDLAELGAVRADLRVWLSQLAVWLLKILPARSPFAASLRVLLSAHLRMMEHDVKALAFDFAWLGITVTGWRKTSSLAGVGNAPRGYRRACRNGSIYRLVTRGVFPGTPDVSARLDRIRDLLDDMAPVIARMLARLLRRRISGRLVLTGRPPHCFVYAPIAFAPAGADTS